MCRIKGQLFWFQLSLIQFKSNAAFSRAERSILSRRTRLELESILSALITLMLTSKPPPFISLNAVFFSSFRRQIVRLHPRPRLLTAVARRAPSFIGLLLIKARF